MNPITRTAALALIALSISSCASAPWAGNADDKVIYALGNRAEFVSPLGNQLTPACPALKFAKGSLEVSAQHQAVLKEMADECSGVASTRIVVAAYCQPGLPPEYARVLSEKRAHSVRQRLVELGVDPDHVQTAGFGNDFAINGPANDVVVIYNTRR